MATQYTEEFKKLDRVGGYQKLFKEGDESPGGLFFRENSLNENSERRKVDG